MRRSCQLCLLIDGAVSLPDLFDNLNNKVDPLILSHLASSSAIPPPGWKRPFVDTTTSRDLTIGKSTNRVVEFMEEDESIGEVNITWLGAKPTDYLTGVAIKILNSYLTHSETSPIQKEFIDIPKPYATSIGLYSEDRVNKNELMCYISDVPVKHLERIADMVKTKMASVSEEGIDMERMGLVLRRDRRKLLNNMETSISQVLVDVVIGGESVSRVVLRCRLSIRRCEWQGAPGRFQ